MWAFGISWGQFYLHPTPTSSRYRSGLRPDPPTDDSFLGPSKPWNLWDKGYDIREFVLKNYQSPLFQFPFRTGRATKEKLCASAVWLCVFTSSWHSHPRRGSRQMGNTRFQGTALTESGSQDFSQDKAPPAAPTPHSVCCGKRWWPQVLTLESGGRASTISEWPHRLTVEALRLLKHCTTEYSQICCLLSRLHQQWVTRGIHLRNDKTMSYAMTMLSVAIKSLTGQVAGATTEKL